MKSELHKNIINLFGDKGKQWLQSLPNIVDTLSKKWQLSGIEEVNHLTWNYVVKAESKVHGSVCLKISADAKLIEDEVKALKYFNGQAMVRLVDIDNHHNAVLLEQAIPGESLKIVKDNDRAIDAFADVFKTLHATNKENVAISKKVADWLTVFDRTDDEQLPSGILRKARNLRDNLLESCNLDKVLHGDLHLDNIIQHQNSWLAIDPKGIIGPLEFEVASFDFISEVEFNQDNVSGLFLQRTKQLSKKLNLDFQNLIDWSYVRLVLGCCWMLEDNGSPNKFLERLIKVFKV